MVVISKKRIEQLEIIKEKLSKMSNKQKMKLLNDKGVKKLLEDSMKDLEKKSKRH